MVSGHPCGGMLGRAPSRQDRVRRRVRRLHLAARADSTVLVRRQEHADRLNQHGLRSSGKTERHSRIVASTDPADLGDVDLIIIATKASDVEDTARRLAGHFRDAVVMTVQNGLGCEEVVAKYGDWPIVSAVTFMSGNRHSDIHVEYELDTATWMGPWAKGAATFEQVGQIEQFGFESPGIPGSVAGTMVEADFQCRSEQHFRRHGPASRQGLCLSRGAYRSRTPGIRHDG